MKERVPARVFGEVAGEYDRVRPPFPEALADDVLTYCGAALDGRRAVEVGAGTGRATAMFARRGVPVVAVEPDDAMADLLAGTTAGHHVDVVRSTFEEFRPAERFGLLFSAEAWHWTDPGARWRLASEALTDGGALALFWNNERVDDPALRASMLRATAGHAPSVVVRDEPVTPETVWDRWPGDELAGRDEFGDRASHHYRVRRTMPKADYLGLTTTRSQFRMLPPPVRQSLLDALAEIFDDEIPLTIDTTLVLARSLPMGQPGSRRGPERA